VLQGVRDGFTDRDHDVVGVLVTHSVEFGPSAQQAPEHHELGGTG
jgi:hypothetical protein